jgi:hypothetical protein
MYFLDSLTSLKTIIYINWNYLGMIILQIILKFDKLG